MNLACDVPYPWMIESSRGDSGMYTNHFTHSVDQAVARHTDWTDGVRPMVVLQNVRPIPVSKT